jgi:hypothetical protein
MSIESERQGGSKRYEILSLHDSALWLADQESISYAVAAKALIAGLPDVPAPEPFGKRPLSFRKDELIRWIGAHRRKLRAAANSQKLSDVPLGLGIIRV